MLFLVVISFISTNYSKIDVSFSTEVISSTGPLRSSKYQVKIALQRPRLLNVFGHHLLNFASSIHS